jgi:fringe protein
MYCLSRPLFEKIKPLVGSGPSMIDTCNRLNEPDDVTVGCTIELFTKTRLSRTKLIVPHTQKLSLVVDNSDLQKYISVSYGCGHWCGKGRMNNVVGVPNAKFHTNDDPTRFKSLHCNLYPNANLCTKV